MFATRICISKIAAFVGILEIVVRLIIAFAVFVLPVDEAIVLEFVTSCTRISYDNARAVMYAAKLKETGARLLNFPG
jgi:hypothetical protein